MEQVRDVVRYEWAPSRVPAEEAVRRGVVQSRREFDSLLPAVLFTHESDPIQHLQPEEWERILRGVMEGLEPFKPIIVTLDFLAQYLRALRTSRIVHARYDVRSHEGTLELAGDTYLATKFYVFEGPEDDPSVQEWEVPIFRETVVVKWRIRAGDDTR